MSKKILKTCCLIFVVLWFSPVIAQPLVISSGSEGGGYWSAATRLQTVAQVLGLYVKVDESTGSLQNLARLLDPDDPTALVLAQADALEYYLDNNELDAESLEILENIGQECVYLVTSTESKIQRDTDLQQDRGYKIGISSPDSGVAVTYAYMTALAPEMAKTTVRYGDTAAALAALSTPGGGDVDAVMLVHRPKEHSPEVDLALSEPDRYRFLEVSDERFKGELPNGDAVYRQMKLAIPVPNSEDRRRVETICVNGLVVANRKKVTDKQRNVLVELITQHWMKVYATGS